MPEDGMSLRRFSFRRRPIPVPGDLRIAWRVALIVSMLGHSRARRASLAKLHILNDAIRSNKFEHLRAVLNGTRSNLPWNLQVEPAFARAIDFAVGDKLATWTKTSGRAALQLTAKGVEVSKAIDLLNDALVPEKALITECANAISEGLVNTLLGESRDGA